MGKRKFVQTGHMTKMAATPIYGKILKKKKKKKKKNHLLQNQKADDLESWYVASGAQQVLPSLFK